jgi:hypothetical protein
LSHIVVLGLCKFNLLRKKEVKPSKIDDDLLDNSDLSYEDSELFITLVCFDMLKTWTSYKSLLLRWVASIDVYRTNERVIRKYNNQNNNKI